MDHDVRGYEDINRPQAHWSYKVQATQIITIYSLMCTLGGNMLKMCVIFTIQKLYNEHSKEFSMKIGLHLCYLFHIFQFRMSKRIHFLGQHSIFSLRMLFLGTTVLEGLHFDDKMLAKTAIHYFEVLNDVPNDPFEPPYILRISRNNGIQAVFSVSGIFPGIYCHFKSWEF